MKMVSNANLIQKSHHKIKIKKHTHTHQHNLVFLKDILEEMSCAVLTIMN